MSKSLFQDDPPSAEELELKQYKESVQDVQPLGSLVSLCRTVDQVIVVKCFIMVYIIYPGQQKVNTRLYAKSAYLLFKDFKLLKQLLVLQGL
jgi:hypothetical protein